ncbi:GspH/FimT family pseudopilin [Comamonas testosteroni]|uniref:GspH/FimT family pseudopilin n=1 Tax=Comamonas testosteroni TaxID=285 RepID=UPI00265E004D|nr:GspH/FimT family pseudopilin [Comamonas testosteroni]WKL17176.1 GspH/FimT family pseudopilin [Comamonas testosteroni]WQD44316.1 GspH/FimT family pseudopilin [Comamonas testosteroni]
MPNSPLIRRHFSKGFTAIELMVTVAILAILAGIAAPSFNPIIERWRVRQISEELQSTLYFARSEAVKRGGGVTILRNTSTDGCTISDTDTDVWNCGWLVFVDKNSNGVKDSGEEILQQTPPPRRIKVKLTSLDSSTGQDSGSLTKPVQVDRWGQLTSDSVSFFAFRLTPLDSSNAEASASSLCVSGSGRIKRMNSSTLACT